MQQRSSEEKYREAKEAYLCRKSFYFFVQTFWDCVISEPMELNWHIKYLCDSMQVIVERAANGQNVAADFDLICIPPGTTKSTIISVMLPTWVWAIAPHFRLVTASHTITLAREFADKSKQIITSEKYKSLFGIEIRGDKSAKTNYANSKGGSRLSVGTGSAITGMHAHLIIVDDPMTANKVESKTYRNSANKYISGTLFSRKIDKKKVPFIIVMQRLHHNDCVGYLIEEKPNSKKSLIVLPAEICPKIRPKPESLAANYIDGLLDVRRLSTETLDSIKDTMTPVDYNAQFLQQTSEDEGGIIKKEWLPIVDTYIGKINFVSDTAYTDNNKNDPSAIAAYTTDSDGNVTIIDVLYGHWEFPALIQAFIGFVGRHNKNGRVEVEPKATGKSIVQVLKVQLPYIKEAPAPVGSKAERLKAASQPVWSGKYRLLRGSWNERFIQEVTNFPNERFDESVDLLTMIETSTSKRGKLYL